MPTDLRFALLGAVRAWSGEAELDLGSPRQRSVLAALLLRRRTIMSPDEIVDAVWGADPPPSVAGLVPTYVMRLRRVLEPDRPRHTSARVLVSVAGGYRLHVAPFQLDLDVFEASVGTARRLRSSGDHAAAARILRDGLRLWQGSPLVGVSGPIVELEQASLIEQRLAALEDCLDAELASGAHRSIVPELTGLVSRYPLRERLHAQLMLALYWSGRGADALAAYQNARRVLVEQCGLEPGPELKRIERAVLNQNPVGDLECLA